MLLETVSLFLGRYWIKTDQFLLSYSPLLMFDADRHFPVERFLSRQVRVRPVRVPLSQSVLKMQPGSS